MHRYSSNQEFYDHIDQVVGALHATGHSSLAGQIHFLLHKVSWTTSSELFDELRDRFEKLLNSSTPLSSSIEADIRNFIITIDQGLARANGSV